MMLLSPEAAQLRKHVLAALWCSESAYVSKDAITGRCPSCGGYVGINFAGLAPRVRVTCYDNGCSEEAIAVLLGLEVKP